LFNYILGSHKMVLSLLSSSKDSKSSHSNPMRKRLLSSIWLTEIFLFGMLISIIGKCRKANTNSISEAPVKTSEQFPASLSQVRQQLKKTNSYLLKHKPEVWSTKTHSFQSNLTITKHWNSLKIIWQMQETKLCLLHKKSKRSNNDLWSKSLLMILIIFIIKINNI